MTAARLAFRLGVGALLIAYLAAPGLYAPLLAPLAPAGAPSVYAYADLLGLAGAHLALTASATLVSAFVGVALAVFVTRPAGAEFLPLARSLANVGQTFPPVAVLALVVPLVGFGQTPTFIALALYGLLPIFEGALAGLGETSPTVREAALASGMTAGEILRTVELPLAAPGILAGMRLTAVIGLSTATIGSTVAARTLGEVVIAGLASSNTAYVAQGALAIAALAYLISDAFGLIEARVARRVGAA